MAHPIVPDPIYKALIQKGHIRGPNSTGPTVCPSGEATADDGKVALLLAAELTFTNSDTPKEVICHFPERMMSRVMLNLKAATADCTNHYAASSV
jgi:hypothetical protein